MGERDWGQPPEIQAEWVDLANRIGRVVVEPPLAGTEVKVVPEFVPAAQVLMFHFGRAFRTFTALGLLLSHGYTQDALVLTRTLLEVLFEMAFVARYPEDAHFFLEHGIAVEIAFRKNSLRYRHDAQAGIQAGQPSGSAPSISHGAWHPKHKSVRSRAVASGVPVIYYDLFYALASRYSHGSGDWVREIARRVPGGIHVSYGADKMEGELVVLMACDTLLQILIVANAALALGLADIIRSIQDDFTSLAARTWEAVFAAAEPGASGGV